MTPTMKNTKMITAGQRSMELEWIGKNVRLTVFRHKRGVTGIQDMHAVIDVSPSIEQVKEIIEWLQSVVREEPK